MAGQNASAPGQVPENQMPRSWIPPLQKRSRVPGRCWRRVCLQTHHSAHHAGPSFGREASARPTAHTTVVCTAEGASAATHESPVSSGTASCAQRATHGLLGMTARAAAFAGFASMPSAAQTPVVWAPGFPKRVREAGTPPISAVPSQPSAKRFTKIVGLCDAGLCLRWAGG